MAYASKLVGFAPPPRPAAPAILPPAGPAAVPPPDESGQRRLIRPHMPAQMAAAVLAPRRLRGSRPLVSQEAASARTRPQESALGTAEAFFFQKQIQTQTSLVFIMEDGEQLHGVVEWCDRESIKIRGNTRTLLYKKAIRYLYKANEAKPE